MYRLYDYGGMIADHGRTRAYAESLKRLVTPASVVVDIGTGTGILALLAGHLGARKVYAIEPNDTIELGRRVAAENGLDGRIEFIHGLSTQVQLPEKADIIVSDLHGVLPAHQRGLFSILDARDRFLRSPGYLIPRRETLWAAIVDVATLHQEVVGVWGTNVFGQAFFPWPTPLLLCGGDEVQVQLRANAVGSEYVYGWETSVRGKDGGAKAAFQQHDFLGQVLTVDRLRNLSSSFTPTLNEDGRIDRMILDGVASELMLQRV